MHFTQAQITLLRALSYSRTPYCSFQEEHVLHLVLPVWQSHFNSLWGGISALAQSQHNLVRTKLVPIRRYAFVDIEATVGQNTAHARG